MSLSDKMRSAGTATAPTPAPAPAPATVGTAGVKSDAKKKAEAFQNHGASIRAQMSDDQKQLEGSMSDKVEFIAALGNPKKKSNRKEGGQYINSNQVVGYAFKVLQDMETPYAPLTEDAKDGLSVQKPPQTKMRKAGETVYMNVMEATMFISKSEFAGAFSGNGKDVFVSVVYSKGNADPTPCLKRPASQGSIKANMIMVAQKVGGGADGSGGTWECIPGCEDFAPLFKTTSARRGGGSGASKKGAGASAKNTAAAFRELFGI